MSILGPILGVVSIGGIGAALVFIPGLAAAAAKLTGAAVSFIVGLPWAKIWWIVPLGAALVYAFIERGNSQHWQKQDASDVTARKQAEQAAATNKASLNGALARINDNNRRIEAANAQLQRDREQAAADQARANARYGATKGAVERLEASAARKGLPPCAVSDEAKKALEGL